MWYVEWDCKSESDTRTHIHNIRMNQAVSNEQWNWTVHSYQKMDWLPCNFPFPAHRRFRTDDELKMSRIVIRIEFQREREKTERNTSHWNKCSMHTGKKSAEDKKILTMCHKTELVFRLHLFDTLTLMKCMEATENKKNTTKSWPNWKSEQKFGMDRRNTTDRVCERERANGRVKTS